jgi:hypothetical protein
MHAAPVPTAVAAVDDDRRPGRTARLGRLTRTSLRRFDRYTLEVFNAGTPYRSGNRRPVDQRQP